jgi:putative lipoprotein
MQYLLTLASVATLLAAGCAGDGGKNAKATITGTVTYLQRIALPPDAELKVTLEDISLQDAPAGVIAEKVIPAKGKQVPLAFAIEYDPEVIEENHSYSVRAEILIGGEPKFTTMQSYPVLTRGNPSNVDVIVMALQAAAPAHSPLVETHWTLVELGGRSVAKTPMGREPFLQLFADQNRAIATGGCNQMTGTYETSGESLKFSQFVSTMRACSDGMDTDRALAQALESTATFRIDGTSLDIVDASGNVLARFQEAALEE